MLNKVKTKSGRVLIVPTPEENKALTKAAMSDRDAKPLTDAQWEAVKPKLRRGRPLAAQTKVMVSVRFDADVIESMKSTGPRWQTRINQVVREWVVAHDSIAAAPAKRVSGSNLIESKSKKPTKQSKRDHGYA